MKFLIFVHEIFDFHQMKLFDLRRSNFLLLLNNEFLIGTDEIVDFEKGIYDFRQ